ncbi:PLC-like phosphodiesterase [Pluteus cervinus]|uniref:PLC-like phosphodiesterase n=1 Tax=Pluteus cervinus TaxID=181527 RepID=A0ACD3AHG0_9AGAR|nr:PLC-like phosphodiesterase [Pluteus cervinus]
MSSTSPPPSQSSESPNRPLQRANNLLTSHGQVVLPELADESSASSPSSSPKKVSRRSLGDSLKRKFQAAKARWDTSSTSTSPKKASFHENISSSSLPPIVRSHSINASLLSQPSTNKSNKARWGGKRRAGHARSHTETATPTPPPVTITNNNETRPDIPPPLIFTPSTSSSSSSSSLPSSTKDLPLPVTHRSRSQSFTRLLLENMVNSPLSDCSDMVSGQTSTHFCSRLCPPLEHDATGGKHAVVVGEVAVPEQLQRGTFITKVSNKKLKRILFSLDPDQGQIIWESNRRKIIPIQAIKEIRSGFDARFYREQFQLSSDYGDRWMSIVYVLDSEYKTLHLIFPTQDEFQLWHYTLRQMHAVRQELMNGLGHHEMREAMWDKQHWRSADEGSNDQKLEFEEVLRLCKRLNINSSEEDLDRWFKQADSRQQGFLDFDDFRKFVKYLKNRPEINRLYKRLASQHGDVFDWHVFERFMRDSQKSTLSRAELEAIFGRYSSLPGPASHSGPPPTRILTPEAFTSFLMSVDNSALLPDEDAVLQDMTRPLSDYYISSSHNTYLVGHQLVGESTVEGYIRALLRGCRSVEVDIYDGDTEPMVFHGKTLTSKVSLREVCQAIAKYGFLTSPYPIIISAEVHCSIPQQDLIAEIMMKEFGDMLIQAPVDEKPQVDALPSPEELKGKIMLKAKNVYLVRHDSPDADSSTEATASSTSDTDGFVEIDSFGGTKKHGRKTPDLLPPKDPSKAFSVLQRVRSVGKRKHAPSAPVPGSAPPPPIPAQPNLKHGSLGTTPSFVVTSRPSRPGSGAEESVPASPHPHPIPPTIRIPHRRNAVGGDENSWLEGSQTPLSLSPQELNATEDVFGFANASMLANASSLAPPASTIIPLALIPSTTSATTMATSSSIPASVRQPKMSHKLLTLLVYTVGVKCRGINKKEEYAPEHMFSLSENTANKMMKSLGGGPPLDEKEFHSEDHSNVAAIGKPQKPALGKGGMMDLIKHNRTHLTRIYPKGMRVNSTNYEPHRFWSAGCQLVALNWQTFDLGYTLNHAMFRRNGRCGYVLKPPALRSNTFPSLGASGSTPSTHIPLAPPVLCKELLTKRTLHKLIIRVISAQQLPTTKEASADKITPDPYVEVSLHVPEWPVVGDKTGDRKHKSHSASPGRRSTRKSLRASRDEGFRPGGGKRAASRNAADGMRTSSDSANVITGSPGSQGITGSGPSGASSSPSNPTTSARTLVQKTSMVKNNGFNPVWEDELSFKFECVGDMKDLVFVKFAVKFGEKEEKEDAVATYCASLASLAFGYRHLPLHDAELSQYLYSTLFVRIEMVDL